MARRHSAEYSCAIQAVLLLRPSVPLYSTDAMPINCSAQAMTASSSANAPAQARPSEPRPVASGSQDADRISPASRTCECLTQTLWCHGCGASVGYMIVVPCVRCTSSMTVTNRTTNGHRFVFYSSEITASERHYISDECGVVSPAFSPFVPSSPPGLPPPRSRYISVTPSSSNAQIPSTPRSQRAPRPNSPESPRNRRHSNALNSRDNTEVVYDPVSPTSSTSSSSPPPLVPVTPPTMHRSRHSTSSSMSCPEPQPLRDGDVLYWHHLSRSGEIPAVADDPRARIASKKGESCDPSEAPQAETDSRQQSEVPSRKLVMGR